MSPFAHEPYDPAAHTIHEILADVRRILKLKLAYEARMNADPVGLPVAVNLVLIGRCAAATLTCNLRFLGNHRR